MYSFFSFIKMWRGVSHYVCCYSLQFQLEAELLWAFKCTIITRWSVQNLAFRPEFSYENLVLLVLLNRLSNKEAVKSAGAYFFWGQLFSTVVEQTLLQATWRGGAEIIGEGIYYSSSNSILASCYYLLRNLVMWNLMRWRYLPKLFYQPNMFWG